MTKKSGTSNDELTIDEFLDRNKDVIKRNARKIEQALAATASRKRRAASKEK